MSKLQYFQRYSQRENWVTNNTLQLLSRLYYFSRVKFEQALNAILSDSSNQVEIGVQFTQQLGGGNSTPDGSLTQESFHILIETKLWDNFSKSQLESHLSSFKLTADKKILLALSKGHPTQEVRADIVAKIKERNVEGLHFASCTYEQIIDTIEATLNEFDLEMIEILEDYRDFCESEGLIDQSKDTLLAFTAGRSLRENLRYNLYYEPQGRSHRRYTYLGLYDKKEIVAVGKVSCTVICNLRHGELEVLRGKEDLSDAQIERIKEVIRVTDYYDIRLDHQFHLVDQFFPTSFRKTSKQGLRSKRYFDLKEVSGYSSGCSAEELAELLNQSTWS